MTPAITREAAVGQANSLNLEERLPYALVYVVWRTVANPQAGPDTLLILADALRGLRSDRTHEAADAIAALAPTRAAPAPPESPAC